MMKAGYAQPLFFGWKVVATAFLVATFAWGIGFYGISVFLEELYRHRGWSVSVISAAITMHFLVSALLVSRLDVMHLRWGTSSVTRAGIVAAATGIVCWSLARAPWQLFAAALLSGAGWAATSGAAITAMVSPWFDRRRPIALGLALNGSSIGGVLFTPLWIALIARIGLVEAACAISVATLTVLWPLAGLYLAPMPEDIGAAPDGDGLVAVRAEPMSFHRPPISYTALLRDLRFVTLSIAFALGLFAQVGVAIHLVTRLAPVFGAQDAGAAVSLVTLCAVLSRLLLAGLMGNADRRLVGMGNFVLKACGMACLALGTNTPMLLVGCVLFGFGMGNLLLLPPLIAQKEFAKADVVRVVALVTAGNQALFAFAPGVLGVLREVFRGYEAPFLLAAVIEIVAAVVLILGRVPRSPDPFVRGIHL